MCDIEGLSDGLRGGKKNGIGLLLLLLSEGKGEDNEGDDRFRLRAMLRDLEASQMCRVYMMVVCSQIRVENGFSIATREFVFV